MSIPPQTRLAIRCLAAYVEAGSADQQQRSDAAHLLREFADGKSLQDLTEVTGRRGRPSDPGKKFLMAYRVAELMLPKDRWPEGRGLNVTNAWAEVANEFHVGVDAVRKAHQEEKSRVEELTRQLWVYDP